MWFYAELTKFSLIIIKYLFLSRALKGFAVNETMFEALTAPFHQQRVE